jgi:hypothetical protein
VKTSFDGFPPKEGRLLLDPSTMSWIAMVSLSSLGRMCDRLTFL